MTTKTVNKHLFVWLGSFLFGGFGVDRFMRGQIGMGICKLLFNWATLGIWSFVDWIVALVRLIVLTTILKILHLLMVDILDKSSSI